MFSYRISALDGRTSSPAMTLLGESLHCANRIIVEIYYINGVRLKLPEWQLWKRKNFAESRWNWEWFWPLPLHVKTISMWNNKTPHSHPGNPLILWYENTTWAKRAYGDTQCHKWYPPAENECSECALLQPRTSARARLTYRTIYSTIHAHLRWANFPWEMSTYSSVGGTASSCTKLQWKKSSPAGSALMVWPYTIPRATYDDYYAFLEHNWYA